ncbi:MAG: hypothetical protein IJ173_03920 [Kiritimatiellae bacterium]|nr:hypothetical protein [Kiritimatiellia bacterium]
MATAATAALGFAEIKGTEGFEDSSYRAAYGNDKPSQDAAYPFDGYGDYYGSLDDDGDVELLADGASCVDAVMQFKCADAPDEFDGDEKLVVFANSDGKLVVVDADAANVTTTDITEGTWYRLTIVSVDETVNDVTVKKFKVYVDSVLAKTEGGTDSFTSRVADSNSVTTMTLSGTGKVDNFVARTTDPFVTPASVVAQIGSEKFETYADALSDALKFGKAITILDGNVVVDGTSAAPYQIPDVASLKALQEAVAAGYGANKYYVQTADIALTEAWPGIGIQNGKDLVNYTVGTASGNITQEEADRRDAKWSAGAFKGTYDGGNYTISNFQMVGVAGNPDSTTEGLDYCGFFNSVDGATIKNLKIQYAGALFATDTTATTKECGATFVGVAKNSTLQNLTSLEGTVSCSKGFGGIVGYLAAGSSVESCTNNVNLTSLANNKVGGIAMICQQSNCSITDCKNNGTTTTKSGEHGGIVGYTDAITIDGCVNTAACKMFYHHGGTVTLSGANKGNATVASYTGVATPGLNFATVDGNVATFVADNALAAGNTYKVMGPNAAYAFAQAGAISFDEALAVVTVTAAEGLVLTTSTSGTVTTYTAAAAVAKIGDTKYTSLAAAVDGAAEGSTIILLADVALTETQTISKSVTLDLNGKKVTATDCRAFHVTAGTVAFTGTGTISTVVTQGTKLDSSSSVIRVGSNTAVTSFTLGENVTVTSDYCYGITYFGTMKQTVVINGTVTVTGVQAAISGNGLATYNKAAGGSDVTVNGTVSATQDYAIYNPQTGTTAITGIVTGGIEVKAGTVTVAGTATVTARNVTPSHSSNQNGTSTQGYAIAAVGNSSYKQPAKVSVAAGATVTGSVIILKENNSETYGEITSAVNTLTVPEGYVWNGPADGVYTLAVASGFDGGEDGKSFTIDGEVTLPVGKVLTDTASAATGLTYAQAAVLGLLDETTGELKKDVTPTISIVNGNVVVSLDGTAVDATRYTVMLNVYEKASLTAEWPVEPTTSYELGSETEAAGFTPSDDAAGFYKVGVTIEDATSGN